MDKLIITVTCDSKMSFPGNPNCPEPSDTQAVADEYVRGVNAGAAIAHTHGSYTSDPEIQPDGRKLQIPVVEGWHDIVGRIRSAGDPILQFGLASMRLEQKLELWKDLGADMSSIAFNSHDEYFQPDPAYPANEVYAVHPVSELKQYARLANEYGVKLEIEAFHTGAFWNINKLREEPGLLSDPLWITLFLGWPGGSWTPPTAAGLQYLVNNLPPRRQLEHELHGPVRLLVRRGPLDRPRWSRTHRHGRLSVSGERRVCDNQRSARGKGRAHCARGGESDSLARRGAPNDRAARKNRGYRVAPIVGFASSSRGQEAVKKSLVPGRVR